MSKSVKDYLNGPLFKVIRKFETAIKRVCFNGHILTVREYSKRSNQLLSKLFSNSFWQNLILRFHKLDPAQNSFFGFALERELQI